MSSYCYCCTAAVATATAMMFAVGSAISLKLSEICITATAFVILINSYFGIELRLKLLNAYWQATPGTEVIKLFHAQLS